MLSSNICITYYDIGSSNFNYDDLDENKENLWFEIRDYSVFRMDQYKIIKTYE
jgi:hypothetical protein